LSRKPAAESQPPSSQEGGDDEEDGDESPAEADEEAVDGSMASDPFAGLMESNLGDVDGNLDDLQPDEGTYVVGEVAAQLCVREGELHRHAGRDPRCFGPRPRCSRSSPSVHAWGSAGAEVTCAAERRASLAKHCSGTTADALLWGGAGRVGGAGQCGAGAPDSRVSHPGRRV